MSLSSPYQEHYYVADGVTTTFAFGSDFTALSSSYVKCIIYFDDGTNCVPTFNVDLTTGYISIVTLTKPDGTVLTVPPAGSIVRVFRDVPEQQNVTASQLQNYTAKQLERIFDSVVGMIQEVSYSDLHKTIRLTETQRDVAVEQLTEAKDQAVLYWDFNSRTLKATDYGQDEIVKSTTVDRLVYLQPEGKIYFIPKGSNNPIAIGSATIHNDLGGRNAPDCHPESAITNLTTHLQELRDRDTAIEYKADQALSKAGEALDTANHADANATYAVGLVNTFDGRLVQAESNASEAKEKAIDAKTTVDNHVLDYNNPHQVTKAQVGLGNCDNTSDEDKPISTATQGALDGLQDQIDDLSGRGHFLALWNCATGLAESNPPESPYTYKSGDYFIVGTVSSADPAVNYKPDGSSYTTGVASTTVETNEVKVDDTYVYDGTNWKLQANSQRQYTFSGIAGSPYDNTNLSNALNGKVDETSTANQVYGTDNSGNQTTYTITQYLKNTATATDAISVYGTANTTWTNGINIGVGSRINSTNGIAIGVDASADVNAVGLGRDADAGVRGTAIGAYAKTSADTGIAIGCWNSSMHNAVSSAKGAYQFGVGTNSTARTLNVGWYDDSVSPSTFRNYQVLDGNTGLIPDARISTNITRTADLATVATTGSYNDLSDKPTIPAAQVNSDWNAVSGVAEILNKPSLATVATSGSYNDLSNKPTIPTVNDATLTIQKNGTSVATFTANASSNVTANISVPTTTNDLVNDSGFITSSDIPVTDVTVGGISVVSAGVAVVPAIPTVNDATITITQGGITKGSFTLNQASGGTIALDAGGGSTYSAGSGIDITSNVISVDDLDCGTM